MRVYGTGAALATTDARGPRRAAGAGFSLPAETAASRTTGTGAPRNIASLDTLLALQAVEEPGERRKRGVKRGRVALDVLDEIKVAVLGGNLHPASLGRLKAAVGALQERTGDEGLDGILAQIELRAEVELAKFSAARVSSR